MNADQTQYTVRQAGEADLPCLLAIKSPLALHKDRLRDADGDKLLYLVVEQHGAVIGFGLLVFERPDTWPDADDESRLPALIDLVVRRDCRNRGAGSFFIRSIEEMARARGCSRFHIGVDPADNVAAHRLYLRLGYTPMQDAPYRSHWQFTDSDGNVHEGNEWNVDLVKDLAQPTLAPPNNSDTGHA